MTVDDCGVSVCFVEENSLITSLPLFKVGVCSNLNKTDCKHCSASDWLPQSRIHLTKLVLLSFHSSSQHSHLKLWFKDFFPLAVVLSKNRWLICKHNAPFTLEEGRKTGLSETWPNTERWNYLVHEVMQDMNWRWSKCTFYKLKITLPCDCRSGKHTLHNFIWS